MSVANGASGDRTGGANGFGANPGQQASGGAGGFGTPPGSAGLPGPPGSKGTNGLAGANGAVFSMVVSQSPNIANGDFSQGLAFFRYSGGGVASVVNPAGDPRLQMAVDDSTGALSLSELTATNGQSSVSLSLDYKFLVTTGTLHLMLDATELLTITNAGVSSLVGTPTTSPNGDFTHVEETITDPSVLGRNAAQLTIQLSPGSPAQVELDNIFFGQSIPEPCTGAALALGVALASAMQRRRH